MPEGWVKPGVILAYIGIFDQRIECRFAIVTVDGGVPGKRCAAGQRSL